MIEAPPIDLRLLMLSGFGAFCTALIAAGWISARGDRFLPDHPNARSLHDHPISRAGGLAILAGAGVGISSMLLGLDEAALGGGGSSASWLPPLAAGALALCLVSLIDDAFGTPISLRLAVQIAVAVGLVAQGFRLDDFALPGLDARANLLLAGAFSTLLIVWFVNLYNFMDGMDGIAAGMAVFGFGAFALLSFPSGDPLFIGLASAMACAAAGFLPFNFPPARLFMGDNGATLLGLVAGAMALHADRAGYFPLWISILVFSPFVVDATITLIRRMLRLERIWEAHLTHYYQRATVSGFSRRRVVLTEYALMLGCAASAWTALSYPMLQWTLIAVWAAVYAVVARTINEKERRRR
ncbi:MraY family glycosyltransferase [Thioalkalivibrio sp. HK1]|uniref:MraY family glycosyltransferase n=1 Tax=Thioalkalivibrio sp. HK1 TaxID=1469245 RepID=UPI0012DDCE85|nr:glycosyltransferase family 4 protein [Thioalkalivibrio sp. HK1]